MDILGHTQISTTISTYAHVLPATQRQAVEEIDRLLGDGRAGEETSIESTTADQKGATQSCADNPQRPLRADV